MINAKYDSLGDTIRIELVRGLEPARDKAIAGGAVILGVMPERLATINVIGAAKGDFDDALRAAAGHHELDAEELIAIARASLAVPDRPVQLEMGARLTT